MHVGISLLRNFIAIILFTHTSFIAFAEAPPSSFTDLPAGSPVAIAANHLLSIGALDADGRFKSNEKVTRAQVVKVLILSTPRSGELEAFNVSSFEDVSQDAWYMRFAEAAKSRKMLSASRVFNPDGPVTKAAFIKMLLLAKNIDSSAAFSDIHAALAEDVLEQSAWHYPFMRYAVGSSMTAANRDGLLAPSREITRGDMALLIYRLDQFIAGNRVQVLLTQTESELSTVLRLLNRQDVRAAEFASARSILTARGAVTSRPNEPLTQGVLRIAKGFQSLVSAFRAGREGNSEDVIRFAKEAYAAADKAETISGNLSSVTARMRTIAKSMADEARRMQAGQ